MGKTISILRESKTDSKGREIENRVILTPNHIKELNLKCADIEIFVEQGAGQKIGFSNTLYEEANAKIVNRKEALSKDIILGVKETKKNDLDALRNNIWISYQHFAQSRERTATALAKNKADGTIFIALETMQAERSGSPFFPCLAPMSEAAAKIVARHADEYALLAKKIISSGLPETGLHGLKTTILGGGSVGKTAAEEFSERGCEVFLLEKNTQHANILKEYFESHEIRFPKVKVIEITPENLRNAVRGSFFLVSAMYTAGKKPEKLVAVDRLKTMLSGGCVYPVDIDQGGGIEGIFETSILDPFDLPAFPGTEVFFFSPPNLPSIGATTASEALGTVILPYIIDVLNKGLDRAAEDNPTIKSGINIKNGKIAHAGLESVFPNLK